MGAQIRSRILRSRPSFRAGDIYFAQVRARGISGARARHQPQRFSCRVASSSDLARFAAAPKGVLVVFCDDGLKFGPASQRALAPSGDLVARAAKAERFTGKSGSVLELIVPEGLKVPRLVVIGVGKAGDLQPKDFVKFGGIAMGKLPAGAGGRHHLRRIARRRHEPGARGRSRARRAAARLCVRSLQDQAQGRGAPQRHHGQRRGERRRRHARGLCRARGGCRRRRLRARSRQRARQRALPGGVRPPRRQPEERPASRSKCSTSPR